MKNVKIRLSDGTEISQVSSFVRNLAVEFSAGLAEEVLEQHAKETAKRIWPDEPCELLRATLNNHASPLSTQFLCMGEFISGSALSNSAEMASCLVIIWFQPGLTAEFEEEALKELHLIDWNQKARGFSW